MHSTQVTSKVHIHVHDVNKMYISVHWLEKLLYIHMPACILVIHVLLQDMRYNPAVDTVNSKSSTLCTFRQDVP